jgi:hypothetical protein
MILGWGHIINIPIPRSNDLFKRYMFLFDSSLLHHLSISEARYMKVFKINSVHSNPNYFKKILYFRLKFIVKH